MAEFCLAAQILEYELFVRIIEWPLQAFEHNAFAFIQRDFPRCYVGEYSRFDFELYNQCVTVLRKYLRILFAVFGIISPIERIHLLIDHLTGRVDQYRLLF